MPYLTQRLNELFHSRTVYSTKSTFACGPQNLNWVSVRRIPGPKYWYVLLCHEIFHHFRCVTGGKILLRDPGTIRMPLFQLWNKSSSKNFSILWQAHRSIEWLKASDTTVIAAKAPPKHLCLQVLNDLMIHESSLRIIFERADFSDPVQKIIFIAENDFSPLFFCPIFVLFCPLTSFFSLLWLKAVFSLVFWLFY